MGICSEIRGGAELRNKIKKNKFMQQMPDENGLRWSCNKCGRMVAPKPKCLYCGGKAAPQLPSSS